jgi:catechol 2,3-dioxygenase-like lactoylglutathione lyase family enzyme
MRSLENMITAVHTLVYADDPDATRAFFRDVLGWPYVDAHEGWLIFGTGPSELGVHPASEDGQNGAELTGPHHEISLMCDDIEQTVTELKAKGVAFAGGISNRGFGLVATMKIPGAGEMTLYQPRHPIAHNL